MLTIPKEKLPTHIACIMDGNGRWANSRHLPRQAGHRAGADTVERCADFCMAMISLAHPYAFPQKTGTVRRRKCAR